jgi:hypothetical protein
MDKKKPTNDDIRKLAPIDDGSRWTFMKKLIEQTAKKQMPPKPKYGVPRKGK